MSTRVQCEHNERARNSTVNFLWLTSSSSLSASSCHRSCRVRRGEGEGGSGEAGRDVMFQLDYRHLYIWYNNIISIVGNIGFTLFHHFITLYLITASCSSPFPFSSPPPPFLPPSSPHRRPHLVYSPLFLHQLVQVSTHDMFSLHTCCRPAAAPWRITHQITDQVSTHACFWAKVLVSSTHACFCAKKSLYKVGKTKTWKSVLPDKR